MSEPELEAGREMDELIAVRVMGLVTASPAPYWTYSRNGIQEPIPAYSTDIAAAWEVVEKMTPGPGFYVTRAGGHGFWKAIFEDDDNEGKAYSLTAPLAICRAALRFKAHIFDTAGGVENG